MDIPANLDHILLGCNDLESGIAWTEERTGIRAIPGGVHPGRGTRNALLQLGPARYLEIIAPDPQQTAKNPYGDLRKFTEPKLITWAARVPDMESFAKQAHAAGFAITGPEAGSRVRQDGKLLRWKVCRLQNDCGGLLPFFIEWDRDSIHPSADAPSGCRLENFTLKSPSWQDLALNLAQLGVGAAVAPGENALLSVCISAPKGLLELTS